MSRCALAGIVLAVFAATAFANDEAAHPMVVFHTNHGDLRIELYRDEAPETVENFLTYVRSGFYDGTVFHRVIPGFVIQGGGFNAELERKPTREPIENESDNGLDNLRGTLSMARTNDPHSATSQFFINLDDNPPLDYREGRWGYAVFGRVVSGMDTVDEIADLPTGAAGPFRQDVPRTTAVIENAEVVSD